MDSTPGYLILIAREMQNEVNNIGPSWFLGKR